MRYKLSFAIATALYIGLIPGAPGTYASLATVIALLSAYKLSYVFLPQLYLSIIGLVIIAGVLTSDEVSRSSGSEDPSCVVIDEVAGQLVTLFLIPLTTWNLVLGLVFFRLFDIWKPFPIRRLEPLRHGVGIMADDLLAGVYANLTILCLSRWVIPAIGEFSS